MNNKIWSGTIFVLIVVAVFSIFIFNKFNTVNNNESSVSPDITSLYKNTEYGFTLNLSKSWEGYTVLKNPVTSADGKSLFGYTIIIRNPKWKESNQMMDIPIQVFTLEQWNKWEATNFEGYPTAAPIGPTERGRNSKYVFATAPRYNYSFATGWEDVDEIIKTLKGV